MVPPFIVWPWVLCLWRFDQGATQASRASEAQLTNAVKVDAPEREVRKAVEKLEEANELAERTNERMNEWMNERTNERTMGESEGDEEENDGHSFGIGLILLPRSRLGCHATVCLSETGRPPAEL